MLDDTEVTNVWLETLALATNPDALAMKCRQTLLLLGRCIGGMDSDKLADFLCCDEMDIVRIMMIVKILGG